MTPFANLAAILLAAGFSRRMGGENKLLKPLQGQPLIAHALATLGELGAGQLIIVAGESAEPLMPLFPTSATILRNDRASEGMGVSLAKGAAALDPGLAGAFVVLADMPFVTRADYQRLADAFHGHNGQAICVPSHGGQRGHPVLFRARDFPVLARLSGDRGARSLLADPETRVLEVEGCSVGILTDFDDPASFASDRFPPTSQG